jgi:hypothetical protein
MDGKLTLITSPDFFENSNTSILFFHLTDDEQDRISKWLSESKIKKDINLYVYTNEVNLPWIFYAFSRCEYKYINFDGMNSITQSLGGYFVGRNNVYYSTKDENLAAIYSHINGNRVSQVETFLESVLIGQRN